MGALIALARTVVGPAAGIIGRGARSVPFGVGTGVGALLDPLDFLNPFGGGGGGRAHRHRRRKMFTNTDLAQFAAASALIGKDKVAALMMIRAAKS